MSHAAASMPFVMQLAIRSPQQRQDSTQSQTQAAQRCSTLSLQQLCGCLLPAAEAQQGRLITLNQVHGRTKSQQCMHVRSNQV